MTERNRLHVLFCTAVIYIAVAWVVSVLLFCWDLWSLRP